MCVWMWLLCFIFVVVVLCMVVIYCCIYVCCFCCLALEKGMYAMRLKNGQDGDKEDDYDEVDDDMDQDAGY